MGAGGGMGMNGGVELMSPRGRENKNNSSGGVRWRFEQNAIVLVCVCECGPSGGGGFDS